MPRTVQYTVYKYEELSKEAKEKALKNLWDINVDIDWWDYLYDDAENVGLKINGFNEYRCEGEFMYGAASCAESILKEHGSETATYKTAQQYLQEIKDIKTNDVDEYEELVEDLSNEFLKSILEDYMILLRRAYDYLTSKKAVEETIISNEYEFFKNGTMAF